MLKYISVSLQFLLCLPFNLTDTLCSPYWLLYCVSLGKNTEASDSFFKECHQERFPGVFESLQETRTNKNIPSFTDKENRHQLKHFCISDYTSQTPRGTIPLSPAPDGMLCADRAGSSAMSRTPSFWPCGLRINPEATVDRPQVGMQGAAVAHLSNTAADLKHLEERPGWKMSFQHRKGSSGERWSFSHLRLPSSLTNSPVVTAWGHKVSTTFEMSPPPKYYLYSHCKGL